MAKLRFADDSVVDVQQNSNIEIRASYQIAGRETYVTLLKLNRGRTEIGANPSHTIGNSLQVETPSAIAAVRGTQFRVAADGDIALQETLDGQVAFSGAEHGVLQTVLLAKGYGSVIEKNQAPLAPIVLPEVPNVSGLPSQLEQVDVAFELKPRPGDTAFVSQLARDAEFTQIIQQQTTPAMPTTKVLLGALVDGQYFLRLRAQESHGLQGQDAIHAFTVKARPIAILELLEPAAVGISSAPITFKWTPNPQNAIYTLQIAQDAQFDNKVYEGMTTATQLTLQKKFADEHLKGGQYFWRVISATATSASRAQSKTVSKVGQFLR